jgi:mono/diheme cytochrome c family protein
MRSSRFMVASALCASVMVLVALTGCSSAKPTPSAVASEPTFTSTGQQIYLTGAGADGLAITRSTLPVPAGTVVMPGTGCAACHGASGLGGSVLATSGAAVAAPNVTYADLVKNKFTDATIAAAIVKGTDEAGKPLDPIMPRWQMSTADVAATIAYLKVIK